MSEVESPSSPGPSAAAKAPAKSQRGVSVFPTARVQRIIKADRDVDICSKEATFLISVATELFVKKLADEAYTNAKLDKRKHVFYKDLSGAVQTSEWLEFLKDAIPTPMALSSALEARQEKLQQKQTEENMILEGTLQDEDEQEEKEEEEEQEEGEEQQQEQEQEQEQEAAGEDEPAAEDDEAAATATSPSKKKAASKKKASKAKQQAAQADDDDEAMDEDAA